MGISTQIFDSSKAGIVVISVMFVIGYFVFQMQYRKHKEGDLTISPMGE